MLYVDLREHDAAADRHAVRAALVAGPAGAAWFSHPPLWRLRGLVDRALGGPGLRSRRSHPATLGVGDVLESWEVDAVEPDRLLLHSRMRLPGFATLELTLHETGTGTTRLTQRSTFAPSGPLGHVYWWAVRPLHRFAYAPIPRAIARAAERR